MKQIQKVYQKFIFLSAGYYLSLNNKFAAATGIDNSIFRKVGDSFTANPDSPAGSRHLGDLIVVIVQILLLVAGSIAVIFLVIGGFRYVISHGKEESAESAKKTMTSAIIGFVIILSAFVIITVIARILLEGTAGTGI